MSAPSVARVCGLRPASAPPEAIGQRRDSVRLLVSTPHDDVATRFTDLAAHLRRGDLLVVNTSATRKSAIGVLDSSLTLHVSAAVDDGTWIVEFRDDDGRRPYRGPVPTRFDVMGAALELVGPHNDDDVPRLWRVATTADLEAVLAAHGRWVRYDYVDGAAQDAWYQNVYATTVGSAEMASAGRPFSHEVLRALQQRGVDVASLVLHCGLSSQESGETPHTEDYAVPRATIVSVNAARREGRRVIAVGTTVVRALETIARGGARVGRTSLILGEQVRAQLVDGIVSGFHPPEASHLDLLAAIVDRSVVQRAYDHACSGGFRSHEFGDSHLLLSR